MHRLGARSLFPGNIIPWTEYRVLLWRGDSMSSEVWCARWAESGGGRECCCTWFQHDVRLARVYKVAWAARCHCLLCQCVAFHHRQSRFWKERWNDNNNKSLCTIYNNSSIIFFKTITSEILPFSFFSSMEEKNFVKLYRTVPPAH